MNGLAWESVADEFIFDGSWRNIYVLGTNIDSWQSILDRLRHAGYDLVYRRGNNITPLPPLASDAFPTEGLLDQHLSVRFANIQANCHFFTPDEIEFDIDPSDVQGQPQLDALLTFMRLLADATNKDSILTPENLPRIVILRIPPGNKPAHYQKFGGFGNIKKRNLYHWFAKLKRAISPPNIRRRQ